MIKILLEIPYEKRKLAKEYNCKWCQEEKSWYTTNPNSKILDFFEIKEVIEQLEQQNEYEKITGLKKGFKLF